MNPPPKPALRARMLARLHVMPVAERRERSERLLARLTGLAAWQNALRVALFASLRSEPDLDALWTMPEAGLAGKICAYPRIEGPNRLALRQVGSLADLRPAGRGGTLREPAADAPLLNEWPDLILVPGLAFTVAGGRLGRGGGFYDRLLAQSTSAACLAVGVGFRFQVLDDLPLERHDAPLSLVLTE